MDNASLKITIDTKEVATGLKRLKDLERQAHETAKAVDGAGGKSLGGAATKAKPKVTSASRASQMLANELAKLSGTSKSAANGLNSVGGAATKTGAKMSGLGAKTDAANDALRRTRAQAAKTNVAMSGLAEGFRTLRSAVVAYIGVQGIRYLAEVSDEATNARNRLRAVTSSTQELNKTFDDLARVSTDSRVSLQTSANLYQRMKMGTSELGLSQKRLVRVTETINKSFKISGATADEASGSIRQLTQAFNANMLRGEELNSINEQAPILMKAIEKQLGMTGRELRKFAETGGITADIMIKAFESIESEVDVLFSQTAKTIEDKMLDVRRSWVIWADANQGLNDNLSLLVGTLDLLSTGLQRALSHVFKFTSAISELHDSLSTAIDLFPGFIEFIEDLEDSTTNATGSWGDFTTIMKASGTPFGLAKLFTEQLTRSFEELPDPTVRASEALDDVSKALTELYNKDFTDPKVLAHIRELERRQVTLTRIISKGNTQFTDREKLLRKTAKETAELAKKEEEATTAVLGYVSGYDSLLMSVEANSRAHKIITKDIKDYEKGLEGASKDLDRWIGQQEKLAEALAKANMRQRLADEKRLREGMKDTTRVVGEYEQALADLTEQVLSGKITRGEFKELANDIRRAENGLKSMSDTAEDMGSIFKGVVSGMSDSLGEFSGVVENLADLFGKDMAGGFKGLAGLATSFSTAANFNQGAFDLATSQGKGGAGANAVATAGGFGAGLMSAGNAVLPMFGASAASYLANSFIGNISAGKWNDALDDALPFFQLGRGLSALGINIGGKPSDRTQSSLLNLGTGLTTAGGFLSGSKFSEENRTAADTATAILSQVAAQLGDLSGELEFIVGSRDGIRVSFNGEELFKSNDITKTLDEATTFLLTMSGKTKEVYEDLARDGETLGESFLRVEAQFQALNPVMEAIGFSLGTTEEEGRAAADALLLAAGGLTDLVAGAQFYYNNFFTEEEKFNTLLGDTTKAFEDLGIEMPTTKEGFRNLVDGLKELDTQDAKLLATLFDLSPAVLAIINHFDELEDNLKSDLPITVKDLGGILGGVTEEIHMATEGATGQLKLERDLNKERDLTIRLLKTQGKDEEALALAREKELDGLNRSEESIMRMIHAEENLAAIRDRNAQRVAAATQRNMSEFQSSLQDPVGNATGLIDRSTMVAWDGFSSLAPAIVEAAEVVEDIAEAIEEIIDLRPLELRLLETEGKELEALALTREMELDGMNEAQTALLNLIYAQEDLNRANAEAAELARIEEDRINSLNSLLDQFVYSNLTGMDAELAAINAKMEEGITSANELQATEEQLAQIRAWGASATKDVLDAEKARVQAQLDANKEQLDAMLWDYAGQWMKLAMEPLDVALYELSQQVNDAIESARLLGATEEQLGVFRAFEERQRQLLIDEADALAQTEAAEALRAINDELNSIASAAFGRLQASVNAEKNRLKEEFDNDIENINTRYESILDGLNSQLDSVNERVGVLRNIASQLASAVDTVRPDLTLKSRKASQARLTSVLDMVKSGADISQFDLTDDLRNVTEPSDMLYGSFAEFALAQAKTRVVLGGLEKEAGKQLSEAERQVMLLQEQIEQERAMQEWEIKQRGLELEEENMRLDLLLENAQAQLDALYGIDNSIIGLGSALSAFKASVQTAAQQQIAAVGGASHLVSQDVVAASRGGRIVDGKFVPGFADGTDHTPSGNYIVGENGPEMLSVPGAKVTPNDELNMDAVKAEIKRGNYEMIKYLKRMWEIADKQDSQGAPTYTVAAP